MHDVGTYVIWIIILLVGVVGIVATVLVDAHHWWRHRFPGKRKAKPSEHS
jgi:hypothetical protein